MMISIIVAYKLCRSNLANRKQYVSVNEREQFDLCLVLHMEYKQNNKKRINSIIYISCKHLCSMEPKKSALVNELKAYSGT